MINQTARSVGVVRPILFIFTIIGISALFALFSSCDASKRIGGLAAKHPDAVRKVCADLFAPSISTVEHTEYVPGKTIYTTDTVTIDCDSFLRSQRTSTNLNGDQKTLTNYVRIPCPPSTSRVDTFTQTKTVTIENKAKIDVLTQDLANSKADGQRWEHGRNTWRLIALIAIGLLLGGVVLKFAVKRFI